MVWEPRNQLGAFPQGFSLPGNPSRLTRQFGRLENISNHIRSLQEETDRLYRGPNGPVEQRLRQMQKQINAQTMDWGLIRTSAEIDSAIDHLCEKTTPQKLRYLISDGSLLDEIQHQFPDLQKFSEQVRKNL